MLSKLLLTAASKISDQTISKSSLIGLSTRPNKIDQSQKMDINKEKSKFRWPLRKHAIKTVFRWLVHFDPLVKKMSDVNHLSGPLRKRKFSSTGSEGHCWWFVIGGFRSVFWVSVFQGSLLVILLWPKPDVSIPNIFDRFHPWTSDFQISMRQKYWRSRLTFEIVKVQ